MKVKHKAVNATLWTLVRVGFDQFTSFVVFVVVARLLGPSDVGVFTLGMMLTDFIRVFSTSGFTDAVTKATPEDEENVARAAFWGNLATSIVCAIFITLVSPFISILMHAPNLTPILIALAWSTPITAAAGTHMARQMRRFGHKTLAIRSLLSGIIGGGTAVWAAHAGWGVWSLVVQRFIGEGVTMITAFMAFHWLPRFPKSFNDVKAILPFSLQMSFSKLLTVFISRTHDVVIGAFAGPVQVGVYRVAKRINDMMTLATTTPLSTVSVNYFVSVREDPVAFRNSFLRIVTISSTLTFPAFFGLAAVSDVLTPLLFGHKWDSSILIQQLLAPICVPTVVSLFTIPVLTAFGQSKKAAQMTTVQLVITVASALIAAPFGMIAIVCSLLFRLYIMIPYQLIIIEKHTGCSTWEVLVKISKPLGASLIMAVAVWLSLHSILAFIPYAFVRLILASIEGAAIYIAAIAILDRSSLRWIADMAKGMVGRKLAFGQQKA